jgi:FKBP12-rapamycin complex-associated protein
MRFDWKDAAFHGDRDKMQDILDHLHDHVGTWLENLGIDRLSLEMEGLGLRPLATTEPIQQKTLQGLARRFYRLAQWTEILQGDFWLTDPDSEVYRYYSLGYKLDSLW